MKKVLLPLFLLFFTVEASAQILNWSSEITVANGNTYGNQRPRIAVGANNTPVVVWGGGTGTEPLYSARWNGAAFGMPMPVTPNGVDPAVMSWQGHDFASSGNTMYVVFKTQPEMMGRIYIVKSTDGGQTWSDTVAVDGYNAPYDRFPSLAVTAAANPAVMFMTFDSTWMSATYVVTNSTDGGQTFGMPANASGVGSSDVCDCCPGYMVIDGSNQVAAWRRNNNNIRDMWAGVSTNSGNTFATGIDLDPTNWMLSACPSSGPAPYLIGDSLLTVFMSGQSGDNRIYLSTRSISSSMNGYSTMLTMTSPNTDQNYPFIAGNGDTVMVVYQQLNGNQTDVYYSWSLAGAGPLLNNTSMLNMSTTGNQTSPDVAFSNGTFHCTWVDDATGNVMYRSATILPSGVNEFINAHSLNMYPNPSNSETTIDLLSFSGAVQIHLTDVSGRIVGSYQATAGALFTIPKQAAGTYYVEAKNESLVKRSKLVIY